VGLLFADRIITEKNDKKGIIGTFAKFFAQRFPVAFPPWGVYAAVTNVTGKHEFAINLVSENTDQVVLPIAGQFEAESATDVIELGIMVGNAVFPKAGSYNLTFKIDGQQVGARVLLVELMPQSGG